MGQLKTSTGHADNVCKRSRTWGACALTFSKTWQDMAHYTHWRHRNKSVKLLLRPHLTALAEEAVASPGIAAMSKLLETQASVKRPKEDYYRRQIDVIDFIWFLCFFWEIWERKALKQHRKHCSGAFLPWVPPLCFWLILTWPAKARVESCWASAQGAMMPDFGQCYFGTPSCGGSKASALLSKAVPPWHLVVWGLRDLVRDLQSFCHSTRIMRGLVKILWRFVEYWRIWFSPNPSICSLRNVTQSYTMSTHTGCSFDRRFCRAVRPCWVIQSIHEQCSRQLCSC